MKGPNWNIKPGTVVDTQVRLPGISSQCFVFYAGDSSGTQRILFGHARGCSGANNRKFNVQNIGHLSQGTTRTPRYSVLIDESHMPMDHIQQANNPRGGGRSTHFDLNITLFPFSDVQFACLLSQDHQYAHFFASSSTFSTNLMHFVW